MALIDQQGLFFRVMICAGLHEMGHLLAIWLTGASVSQIRLSAMGAEIQLRKSALSPVQNGMIVAAGPIFSLLTALIFAWQDQIIYAGISFLLGAFNSLPILPLDGGQLLQILWGNRFPAVVSALSWIGAVLLSIAGVIFFMQNKENFSLLIIGMFLLSRQLQSCKLVKKAV